MIINSSNPRTTKGMELNGDVLSGDTYGMREYIKKHWNGKWNAYAKTWTVDSNLVVATIKEQAWGFTRILSISNDTPAQETKQTHGADGYCHKCHTYCYGDCQS